MSADAPLVPGPIHGIRVWSIHGEGGGAGLAGMFQETPWPPRRPFQARCADEHSATGHEAPVRDCACGIYAFHPSERALRGGFVDFAQATPPNAIAGIVAAWGRVELYEDGFRAQYAQVRALALVGPSPLSGTDAAAEALARRYGAECLRFPSVEGLIAYCREHDLGLDEAVVEELVPDAPEEDWEEDDIVLTCPPPAGPLPQAAPRKPRTRWRRFGDLLLEGVLVTLGVLWYGFWALAALFLVIGIVRGDFATDDPSAPTGRHLRAVEERLVRIGNELHYTALVRNTSEVEAVVGVRPRGRFLDAEGRTVARLGDGFELVQRAHLGPGQVGIVSARRRARGVDARQVETYAVGWEGRRTDPHADDVVRTSFEPLRLDRSRCRLALAARSPERLPQARLAVLVRDRVGAITSSGRTRVGPVPAGHSRFALDGGEPCPPWVHAIELYPRSTRAEIAGERSGSGPQPRRSERR